jgi:hypothetical protein
MHELKSVIESLYAFVVLQTCTVLRFIPVQPHPIGHLGGSGGILGPGVVTLVWLEGYETQHSAGLQDYERVCTDF